MAYRPIDFVPDGSCLSFIKLTVEPDYSNGKKILRKALYKCNCGKEIEAPVDYVKCGDKKSCGCLNSRLIKERTLKHGLSNKHPLYSIWKGIKSRCYNKTSNKDYPNYGGKGVIMCDEWKNDFKEFYDWCINNGWEKGLQIDKDKIPYQKNIPALIYSPYTCCFLTQEENNLFQRTSKRITLNGVTKNISQWDNSLGLNNGGIDKRLKRGWSLEKALTVINKTKV